MNKAVKKNFLFFKQHYLIFLIVVAGTFLRVWQLDSKAIFFSDAGRDLMVAKQAVEDGSVPLLGIPSSIPRFKQGPVSIWIEMITIALFGVNTLAVSLVFAVLSILAIIALYEFVCVYIGRKQAIVAAAFLAFSPLAIAHGRVPYHTTPLPLALVLYLFSLMLLWEKRKFSTFLSVFAFCFLFQFELSMAALILLIPFVMWQRKIRLSWVTATQALAGAVLGLLPQVTYDVTHNFQQIGVFILWVGHKVLEFLTFQGGGSTTLNAYMTSIVQYGGRIFSTGNLILNVIFVTLILIGFFAVWHAYKKKILPTAALLSELALVLLTLSYFVHGSPSEAYYPPYFILLSIHLTLAVFFIPKKYFLLTSSGVVFWATINIVSIFSHNFFVDTEKSFSYGTSVESIRNIVEFASSKSQGTYTLHTTAKVEEKFPTFFDNYRWLALEQGLPPTSSQGKDFYLADKSEIGNGYENYFYRDFSTLRVYWDPQQPARHEDTP